MTDSRIVAGGLVLAAGETAARAADILLRDDSIEAIVPPGSFPRSRRSASMRPAA